MLKNANQAREN